MTAGSLSDGCEDVEKAAQPMTTTIIMSTTKTDLYIAVMEAASSRVKPIAFEASHKLVSEIAILHYYLYSTFKMSYADVARTSAPVAVQPSFKPSSGTSGKTDQSTHSADMESIRRRSGYGPKKNAVRAQGSSGGVMKGSSGMPISGARGYDSTLGSHCNHYTGHLSRGRSQSHRSRGPRRPMIDYTDREKRTPSVDNAIQRYLEGSSLRDIIAMALVKGTPKRL